jgi:SAM-dependent methyltransferase
LNDHDGHAHGGVPGTRAAAPAGEAALSSSEEQFWEDFYQDRDQVWSGQPNPLLVREVTSLTPGTALDVGCGEGADAIWLARHGWRVTAADVSATALHRAAAHAAEAGVADRVAWARHDLTRSFPGGFFDLVSAQFLQSPVAAQGEREAILSRSAGAVAPGGTLLIASHAAGPSWGETRPSDYHFPTIPEILDALNLPGDRWRVEVAELVERDVIGPEGQPGRRGDTVIRARRVG